MHPRVNVYWGIYMGTLMIVTFTRVTRAYFALGPLMGVTLWSLK